MKIDPALIISLLLALVCVLGGLKLVPLLAGSEETPWPQVGIIAGWLIYRAGWSWWKRRAANGAGTVGGQP